MRPPGHASARAARRGPRPAMRRDGFTPGSGPGPSYVQDSRRAGGPPSWRPARRSDTEGAAKQGPRAAVAGGPHRAHCRVQRTSPSESVRVKPSAVHTGLSESGRSAGRSDARRGHIPALGEAGPRGTGDATDGTGLAHTAGGASPTGGAGTGSGSPTAALAVERLAGDGRSASPRRAAKVAGMEGFVVTAAAGSAAAAAARAHCRQ